ncbi:hypothetical protein OG905_37330 [Streptomyces sp. NBC_00322]|nr:hypothetical protein [Streptomyces sp. NBC_00322]
MGVPGEATRASYDRVAEAYATQFSEELRGKPLDRALTHPSGHGDGSG